jgi:hypothetical protein
VVLQDGSIRIDAGEALVKPSSEINVKR